MGVGEADRAREQQDQEETQADRAREQQEQEETHKRAEDDDVFVAHVRNVRDLPRSPKGEKGLKAAASRGQQRADRLLEG